MHTYIIPPTHTLNPFHPCTALTVERANAYAFDPNGQRDGGDPCACKRFITGIHQTSHYRYLHTFHLCASHSLAIVVISTLTAIITLIATHSHTHHFISPPLSALIDQTQCHPYV